MYLDVEYENIFGMCDINALFMHTHASKKCHSRNWRKHTFASI